MRKESTVMIGVAGVMLLILSCATAQQAQKEPETPQIINISETIPVFEPLEDFPWEQTKDDVTIKLIPEQFQAKVVYERELQQKRELFVMNDAHTYRVTERPVGFSIVPDHLMLQLHLVNNLQHVLRMHGSVPSLKIDGRDISIDRQTQDELLKAVLTPYQTLDVTLTGPPYREIKDANTVNFSIYDVITAVDEANNPTKRTTFEWIFSMRPKNVSRDMPVKVREQRMTPTEAASLAKHYTVD